MSVTLKENVIVLTGNCGVEEAETLLTLVQGNPTAPVEVSGAGSVHTALWQIVLALSPEILGEPADPFTQRWIMPTMALRGNAGT